MPDTRPPRCSNMIKESVIYLYSSTTDMFDHKFNIFNRATKQLRCLQVWFPNNLSHSESILIKMTCKGLLY